MDIPLFISSPVEGHLACFQVLAVIIKVAVTLVCRFSLLMWFFNSFGLNLRGVISQSYFKADSVCKKLPNCLQTVSFCITTYVEGVPAATHPHQHLVLLIFFFLFLTVAILLGVQWYFILICNFLRTYDIEYLLICLFDICIFSLVGYLLRSFAHIVNVCVCVFFLFFSLLSLRVLLYILDTSPLRVLLCILDTSPLSDICFANIFSQSVACLSFS